MNVPKRICLHEGNIFLKRLLYTQVACPSRIQPAEQVIQTSLVKVSTFYSGFDSKSAHNLHKNERAYFSHIYKNNIYYKLHKREENRRKTLTTIVNITISVGNKQEKFYYMLRKRTNEPNYCRHYRIQVEYQNLGDVLIGSRNILTPAVPTQSFFQ